MSELKPNPSLPKGMSAPEVANLTLSGEPRFASHQVSDQQQEVGELLSQPPVVKRPDTLGLSDNPESPEDIDVIVENNQKMFTALGLINPDTNQPYDLNQEYTQGNILFPSQEQQESAKQLGHTQALIIPGNIPTSTIKDLFETGKYKQEFQSDVIYLSDQAKTDWQNTTSAKSEQLTQQNQSNPSPTRPNQLYLIYTKPDILVQDAHPETAGLSAKDCQDILTQHQQENPELNLKGLTLKEYCLLDALTFTLSQKHLEGLHPDSNIYQWSWLLEETVIDPITNQPVRCLCALWDPVTRRLGVGSDRLAFSSSFSGARFAAVPVF